MKNRLIASVGLLVIFVMSIFPPNQITVGRTILAFSPGFFGTIYGILCILVFIASLVGVVIFITMIMKKSIIPVIVDYICVIIAVLFVLFRFISGGMSQLYLPTTYFFIAGAVIAAIFIYKYRSSGE